MVADPGIAFQRDVAAVEGGPVVVLLEEAGADEAETGPPPRWRAWGIDWAGIGMAFSACPEKEARRRRATGQSNREVQGRVGLHGVR
jgi:hypothetical protein